MIDRLSSASEKLQSNPSNESALSHWASEAWTATKGVARVAENVGVGVLKESMEHPLATAGEVAGGIAVAAAATELGIGALGTAALIAVPLTAYGAYEGVKIAMTEGPGAIPGHISEAYQNAKQTMYDVASDIGTVYGGIESGANLGQAESHLQNLGREAAPMVAGGVGGLGSGLGREALSFGGKAMAGLAENILPSLEWAPAVVPGMMSDVANTAVSKIGLDGPMAGAAAESMVLQARDRVSEFDQKSPDAAPEKSLDDKPRPEADSEIDSKRQFVDGSGPRRAHVAESAAPGFLTQLGTLFSNSDDVLSGKMPSGFIKMTSEGDYLLAKVEGGSRDGFTAIMTKGEEKFLVAPPGDNKTIEWSVK